MTKTEVVVDYDPRYLRDELVLKNPAHNIARGQHVEMDDIVVHLDVVRIDLDRDETLVDRMIEALTAHKKEGRVRALKAKVDQAERRHQASLRAKDDLYDGYTRAVDDSQARYQELLAAKNELDEALQEDA